MSNMNPHDEIDLPPRVSNLRLVIMGFLTLWCPYIFVWFIQKPIYPKIFRIALTGWAVIWVSTMIFYIVDGLTGQGHMVKYAP